MTFTQRDCKQRIDQNFYNFSTMADRVRKLSEDSTFNIAETSQSLGRDYPGAYNQ